MPLADPRPVRRTPPLAGTAPSWAALAHGAHLWDAHDRRHLDMSCASGAVLLGHAEPRVEAAAAAPSPHAEAQAARLLADRTGGGEVRFTGDADEARRLALAVAVRVTDRLRVIGPESTEPADGLADVAAIVARPEELSLGRLRRLRIAATQAGALLILDESACGLRRPAGAFSDADLVIHGSDLANGRRLGALCGDAGLLADLTPETPASPSSLAAAAAVLGIVEREDVALQLAVRGAEVQAGLEAALFSAGAGELVAVQGDPTAVDLSFEGRDAPRMRRRFLAQLAARGVHAPGALHVSARHEDAEIVELLDAVESAAAQLVGVSARAA